ncbi:hypothetical protein [Mastigocladopsis repens]|uniref:hypothetical protein n=1 Tax=Mastigocladopsis repens TaxID=221287 RepID=UPI0002E02551|nr:hypothetical protein [Mastigocladopsis repens]
MLKFLTVGAVIAAVLNTPVNGSLLTSAESVANQKVKASTSNLVVTVNAHAELTNAQTSINFPESSNTPEVVEQIDPTGIMLGLFVLGSAAIAVVLSTQDGNNRWKSISQKSKTDTILLKQASRRLQQKLLSLLHNDWDAANRLLAKVKMKNPNRSVDWYVEKVIYDLERDRA